MAISIRQLLGKLRGGVRALKTPFNPPRPIQINFSRFKQTPRVRQSIREAKPLFRQAQQASRAARIDQVVRNAPKTLPRARFAERAKTPVGRFALSIPQELINAPRDVFAGSLGLGANISDIAAGRRPTRVLTNLGTVGIGFSNIAGGGRAAALAKAGAKGSLRKLTRLGARQGARLGLAGGISYGLTEEGSTADKLKAAALQGAAGLGIGAGLGVAAPIIGRGLQRHKEAGRPFGLSIKSVGEGPTTPRKVPGIGKDAQVSAGTLDSTATEVPTLGLTKQGLLDRQASTITSLRQTASQTRDNPIRKLARGETIDLEPVVIDKQKSLLKEIQTEEFTPNLDLKAKIGVLDRFVTPVEVYSKIGLRKIAETLRLTEIIAKKEIDPHIIQIRSWAERVSGNRKEAIFNALDGEKIELNPEETQVVKEIREYFDEWANRFGLPKDRRISDYITHLFDADLIKGEFDPDLARLIEGQVPGSVFNPFLLERKGALNYKKDPWLALSAYAKRGVRKANYDPVLAVLKKNAEKLEVSQRNYVLRNASRINLRPTELDNAFDNFIKADTPIGYKLGQRPTQRITQVARRMGFRGAIGGNMGTAILNLTQGVNTYAALGEKYTIQGYMKALRPGTRKELEHVGVLASGFIDDQTVQVYKDLLQKIDTGLFFAFNKAEQINRGAAYYGAKQRALDAGKSEAEAILEGIDLARKTQFTFGAVDTPEILSSDIAKTVFQFQSFQLKQAEFLKNMIKKDASGHRDFAGLIRWIGANAVLVATVGKLIGFEAKDAIPFSSPLTGQTKIGQTPAISAIRGVGGAGINVAARLTGQEPVFTDRFQRPLGLGSAAKSVVAVIPGGVQARKTIQGIGAASRGFSASATGRARFPVEGKIRAAIFGQFNNPFGRFYFDNNLTPLGDKDTSILQRRIDAGQDPKKVWKQITEKRVRASQVTKIKELRKEKLTPGQRTRRIREIRRDTQTLLNKLKRL